MNLSQCQVRMSHEDILGSPTKVNYFPGDQIHGDARAFNSRQSGTSVGSFGNVGVFHVVLMRTDRAFFDRLGGATPLSLYRQERTSSRNNSLRGNRNPGSTVPPSQGVGTGQAADGSEGFIDVDQGLLGKNHPDQSNAGLEISR